MTPKEKAKELIKRYYRDSDLLVEDLSWIQAKECALIAVYEILNHHSQEQGLYRIDTYYWKEVKQEIEKL
jgi:hypothetical protein